MGGDSFSRISGGDGGGGGDDDVHGDGEDAETSMLLFVQEQSW